MYRLTQDSHCGNTVSDYCKKGFCYACPSDTPYWNATNGTCGTCLEDSHCTDTTRPFCAKDGVCGVCSQDSHCTDATRPFCNDRGMCVECTSDTHCDTGQYCRGYTLINSCTVAYPSECDDLEYTTHPITYTDANGISKTETFYVSKYKLDRWNAEATCRALNKEMLSVHDLVTGWEGSSGTYPKTALFDALYNVLSDKWDELWLKGETVSLCFTDAVKPDGAVYSHGSLTAYYYAVCH